MAQNPHWHGTGGPPPDQAAIAHPGHPAASYPPHTPSCSHQMPCFPLGYHHSGMFFAAPYAQPSPQPDYTHLLDGIARKLQPSLDAVRDELQAARRASDERLLKLEDLMKEVQNATTDANTKIQNLHGVMMETKDAVKDARDASAQDTEAIREQLAGVQEKLDHVVTIQEAPNEIAPAALRTRRESVATNPEPLQMSDMDIEEPEEKTSGYRRPTEEPEEHDQPRRDLEMTTWDASCMHSSFMSVDTSGQKQASKSLTPVNWSHNRHEPKGYTSQDSSRENTPHYPPGSDLDLAPYKIVTERSVSPDDTVRALRRSVLGDSVAGAVVLDAQHQRASTSVLPPPLAHVPSTPPLPSPPPTTSPDPRRGAASSIPPRYSETPSPPGPKKDSELAQEAENAVVVAQSFELTVNTSDPTTSVEPQEREFVAETPESEHVTEEPEFEAVVEAREPEVVAEATQLVVDVPATEPVVDAQANGLVVEAQEISERIMETPRLKTSEAQAHERDTETQQPELVTDEQAPEHDMEIPQPELITDAQVPEHDMETPQLEATGSMQKGETEYLVNPHSPDAETKGPEHVVDDPMVDSPPESTSTDRDQEEADVILALTGGPSAHSSPTVLPRTPRTPRITSDVPLSSPLTVLSSDNEDEPMATEKPSLSTPLDEGSMTPTPKPKKPRRKTRAMRAGDYEEDDDDERMPPPRRTSVVPPPRPSVSIKLKINAKRVSAVGSSQPSRSSAISMTPELTLDEIMNKPEEDRTFQDMFRLAKAEGRGLKRKSEVLPTTASSAIELRAGRKRVHVYAQEQSASAPPLKKKRGRKSKAEKEVIEREKRKELERLREQQEEQAENEEQGQGTLPGKLQRSLTGLGRHNKERAVKKRASEVVKVKIEPDANAGIPPPRRRGRPRKNKADTKTSLSVTRTKSESTAEVECEWPAGGNFGDSDGFYRQLIQCDNCDVWYHYGCAGISVGDMRLEEGVTFICPPCNLEPARRISQRGRTESCGRPDCQLPPDEREFFMERIIGRRRIGHGEFKWLVKWDGYPVHQADWITEGQMTDNSAQMFRGFVEAARSENIDLEEPQEVVLLKEAKKGGWAWDGSRYLISDGSD